MPRKGRRKRMPRKRKEVHGRALRRRKGDIALAVAAAIVVLGVLHVVGIMPGARDGGGGWVFRITENASSPEPHEESGAFEYAYEGTVRAYDNDCWTLVLRMEGYPSVYERGYFVIEDGWYKEIAHVTSDGENTYEEVWDGPRLRFTWPARRTMAAAPLSVGDVFESWAMYRSTDRPGFENASVSVRATVAGEEVIDIAAGRFSCLKIDFEENVESGVVSMTYGGSAWYCPRVKVTVKTEFAASGVIGSGALATYVESDWSYELTSEGQLPLK